MQFPKTVVLVRLSAVSVNIDHLWHDGLQVWSCKIQKLIIVFFLYIWSLTLTFLRFVNII